MRFHRFEETGAVRLADIPEEPPKDLGKHEAKRRIEELDKEIFELQDWMWGARMHSLLLVLQGRDAAGKDGAVKHLSGALNARGVVVTSFGVPTEEEREHDFLWRVHAHAPRAGRVAIFNRSHYEDVLVARVKKLAPKDVWKERYALIDAFERTLATADTIVLKFFLHISKAEQEERLLAREKDPADAWKLSIGDWEDRDFWDHYTAAYEDVIGRCAAPDRPWIVVPANAKWYRDLVIAEAVADALRPHKKTWRKRLDEEGKVRRRDLEEFRAKRRSAEK